MKKIDERKIKRDRYLTKEKTVALMATLGFIVNSLTANATKITAGSTGGTTITNKDGVYDIETTNKKGNNAFNHFNQFELSPNNIANMYFGTKQDNSAENLFNFVDSRIEVNGTVNAIKNNKIGGNLYFLSSDGMVVGNTGTINTGSLHVITPSKIAYADAVQKAGAGEVATGITPNAKGEIQIPLNPEGTIVVRGQINAVDQIGLYAANIKVGNVGTESNGSTDYTQKFNLKTGVTDFSNLVNIKDIDGKILDSGLKGKQLKATKTGNGNIILMAKADAESSNDQTFNDMLGDVITLDKVVPRNIKASIEIKGDISAAGDIVAKAEAVNGTVSAIDEKTGDILYNSNPLVSTTAKIDIAGGNLSGKNIDIDAVSTNKYIELVGGTTENTTGAQGSAGILGSIIKIDGSIGALKGDATVNIEKDATIDAKENLDVSAKNDVSLTLGSSVSAKKSKWAKLKSTAGVGGKPGALSYLPATAAAVGYAEGNASVNIEGTLKSGGKMKLEASSSNEMDLNATAMLNKADNKLVVGLGLAVGNNNSSVNIKNGATINAGKDLDIKSTATNSLTSIVDVVAGNATPFATTVNLVAYDSSSNINIKDSSITSEGNIDIDSQNIVTENKIISDNTAGKKKTWLQKFKKDELNAIKNGAEAQRLINNLKGLTGFSSGATPQNSTSEAKAGGKDSGKKAGIGEKIALGAAMAFVGEENSSNVNIQSSNITAKNDLNINSKTHIQDTLMSVAGDTVRDNKTNFAIGAGVLYGQVGNTSSIMIDGEQMTTDDKSSVITVENGNINIHSTTQMDYARVDRMVQELKDSIANLQSALNELKNYSLDEAIRTTIAELEKNLQGLESEVGDFSASMQGVQLDELFGENGVYQSFAMIKQAQAVSEQLAALSTAIGENLTPDLASLMSSITDSIMNASEFANVGNYGNFSVRATARNLKGDVGIAGAVSITNLQNDSKIVVGKGTTLNARKDLDIESTNKVDAVNVGGNIGQLVIKANGGGTKENSTAIGGSFIMQDFDSNNIIAVAEGAKLKGSNINILANNDIFNVDAVLSAGKSAGNAINGMVSYSTGSVNNVVSIDDEVLLETTGNTTEDTSDDKITIKADSNTFVVNVAGGVAKGGNTGAGAGVAINEFDVNNKVEIKDNDNNEELAKLVGHQHKNKVLDVIKNISVGDLIFTDDEEDKQNQNQNIGVFKGNNLNISKTEAGIKTNQLIAGTITTGEINSISVAGSVSSRSEGGEKKEGIFDSLKKGLNSKVEKFNKNLDSTIGKFNNNGAVNEQMNKGSSLNTTDGSTPLAEGSNNVVDNTGAAKPTLNIAVAGSSSTNLIDNTTSTEIDGIDITLRGENSSVDVTARDESFTGAWSGAAAINWINKKGGSAGGEQQVSGGTSVGVHGAVGINIVDRETTAQIKNSTIKDADSINVESVNDSVTVAAGLGLGLAKNGAAGNKNYQGGASVSLNNITHNTNAFLENVNTDATVENKKSNIKVNALESGIQVTGGVNVNVGKSSGAAGAAVTVANINNTINAGIKGGNLQKIGNVNVDGTLDMTQVTAAAAIGATSGEKNIGVFEGAVVYNGTNNTVNSFIDSANIDADGNINVTAGDTKSSLDKNKYTETLKGFGIDSTGEGYYNGLETGVSGDRTTIENDKSGSTIVTGALSVAGSNSNALGAGVVVNNIKNKFTAEIKGSKENNINADTINVGAAADTFVVGAAGGVGVGKDSFGGMGSVSWQELTNDVTSKISGVNITAREVNVTSKNNAFETNSAGQITYGGKAAVGASLAYTNIENSTSATIKDAIINLKNTKDETKEKNVNVVAESGVENYTVAAGASASKGKAAVAGTVAVAQGGNSTLATVEGTVIKDVDNLTTTATDENKVYTIAGTITGSAGAAIGGAGAYSELDKNEVKAALNTVNITTGANGNINIGAKETSKFYTIGAGVGGAGKVAVQGAASISMVNKSVDASMTSTNINSEEDSEERKTNLNVIAQSRGEIISNASVIAGAGKAAIGAGTAVNNITQNTTATIDGGSQKNIKDALVKSKSLGNITTIGIGGSGAGSVGITGSIAVNQLNNNTKTTVANNSLSAFGNVGVIAQSDDIISNYAGTAAGGGTAAIGASVSVNQISGDTLVSLDKAKITAKGEGNGIEISSDVENKDIIDSIIAKETVQKGNDLADKRKTETVNGIVVDSSSTHTLKSLLANGGIAGTAAVNGTVNVNEIGGNTGASITGSTLNSTKNLSVSAKDYTNSSGIVGTIAAGMNAGVGASSDTNIVDRDANVTIGNSNLTGSKVDIDAVSKQGVSSFGVGFGAAVQGAGVAGTVTVVDLKGDTSVIIKDGSKIVANEENADINAEHYGTINTGTGAGAVAGIGAGVGAAVSVIKDQNHTIVDIAKTDITANKAVNIGANNLSKVTPTVTAVGVAGLGAGVAGTVAINNIANVVATNISDSNIKSTSGNIDISAKNRFENNLVGVGVAGGFAGVGAVVNVNTVDSAVAANISGTTITAENGDIKVNAEEERDIKQIVTNVAGGAAAIGANVLVNNFGKAENLKIELDDYYTQANNEAGKDKYDNRIDSILTENNISIDNKVTADKGGSNPDSNYETGIKVNIDNGSKLAGNNVNVNAKETNKITSTSIGTAAGGVSASGTVAITNINRNVGINIANSNIKTKDKINIGADTTGNVNLDVWQGSAGAASIGAAYGAINSFGNSLVNLSNSDLTSSNSIVVTNRDNLALNSKASGLTAGLIAVGAIVSEAENNGTVGIVLEGSSLTSTNDKDGKINIETEKANEVKAKAIGGSVGITTGAGVTAIAKDNGNSNIAVNKGNTFKGNNLTAKALNMPSVTAKSGSASVGLLENVGVSVTNAIVNAKAGIKIADGNNLLVNNADITGEIGIKSGKKTAVAETNSISGGIATADVNTAFAKTNSDVTVDIGKLNYKENNGTNLSVQGKNSTETNVNIAGIGIGGLIAMGANVGTIESTNNTLVKGAGGNLKNAVFEAVSSTNNSVNADGSGGGAFDVGVAASAKNTMTGNTKVELSGDWNVAEELKANALETNKVNLVADALRAAGIGVSGTKVDNTIKGAGAQVIFRDNTNITGTGSVSAQAKNVIDVTESGKGSGYGVASIQGAYVNNTINKDAKVVIGTGVNIKTDGKQSYEATTDTDLDITSHVKAAGAVVVPHAHLTNNVTINNSVQLGKNSTLKTNKEKQDITLAASNNLAGDIKATADIPGGAAGVATASVNNNIARKDAVEVNGTIYSTDNVNLYTGMDRNGNKEKLDVKLAAEAFNRTALPLAAAPSISNKISQNNKTSVTTAGNVQSVRDINVVATGGNDLVRKNTAEYTWVTGNGKDYTTISNSSNKGSSEVTTDNVAELNGKLTAGIQNKQNIVINGIVDMMGIPEGTLYENLKTEQKELFRELAKKTLKESERDDKTKVEKLAKELFDERAIVKGATDKPEISGEYAGEIKYGIMKYGSSLFKRYQELQELVNSYNSGKNGDNKAYLGYKAEQARILSELEKLNLVSKDSNGNITPIADMEVQFIELPDIIASGGNIIIDADNLTGNGKLTAKGAPEISIINNSNLYLKVNDLKIGEPGGAIKFNGIGIDTGDNKAINSLNKDKKYTANFKELKTSDSGDAKITIENNWTGNMIVTAKDGNKVLSQEVKPLVNIEINGNIENMYGQVNISNKEGDIVIQGKDVQSGASVDGKEVILSAVKGSISQGYTDGIVNIGSNPQAQWDKTHKDTINGIKKEDPDLNKPADNQTKVELTEKKSGNGIRISGGSIYINAADINLNGYVQSGYEDYELNLGSDLNNKIDNYKKNYKGGELTNDQLKNYKLNNGGRYEKQADGTYKYIVQAYYNPYTDEIVVEDINPTGGKVYLTGRVTSTGGGKIVALDGSTDIDITNNTGTNLSVGNINNNNINGLISITDTREVNGKQVSYTTEYTRNGVVTKEVGTDKIVNLSGVTANKYTPDKGLRYNWTEGYETSKKEKYEMHEYFKWWGAYTSKKDVLHQHQTEENRVSVSNGGSAKQDGTYIGKVNGIDNNKEYVFIYDNDVAIDKISVKEWTEYANWLHFKGWQHYEWTHDVGSTQTYMSSVKADHAIDIGFIGQTNGTIDINSNSNIALNGSLKNNNSLGSTTINSSTGSIVQNGGIIHSDNVNLNAVTGIKNINISSIGNNINLNAVTKNGDISIGTTAGLKDGKLTQGNLVLNKVTTGSGTVDLSAYGNITQKNSNDVSVKGNRINLNSTLGGIDLIVQGGTEVTSTGDSLSNSINAKAKNNISLTQATGDFRIGTVESEEGDITINVKNGSLVDALPTGEMQTDYSTEDKIERWKELGLIAGSEEYLAAKKQEAEDYKVSIENEYNSYLSLKSRYENSKSNSEELQKDSTYETYKKLSEKYQGYDSAEAYLAKDSKYAELSKTPEYQWSENDLLYAIQEDMVNQTSGSTQKEIKNPNIIGKNITINASNGVGVDAGSETIDLTTLTKNDYEGMKKLAAAEAADVVWDEANNKATITKKNPIGIQMKTSDGKLNVNAKDNIYLAARTEKGGNSDTNTIYVDNITTGGNIRVLGTGGVFNVSQSGPNFTGNNLILEGGSGNLGAVDKALTTALKGTLTARSDGSIYLNQTTGNMNIAAIYAGKNVNLISAGGIFSTGIVLDKDGNEQNVGSTSGREEDKEDKNLVLGYINAGEGIDLKATGDIGKEEQGLNILNGKTHAVNASGKNIYLQGKKDGALLLGDINSNGNIIVKSEDLIKTSGTIGGTTVNFNAENSITLGSEEKGTTITSENLTLTANNGDINQLANNNIVSNNVTANANTGINLGSDTNKFNLINLGNNTGDILVNNSGANGLGVTFDRTENAGNITINNSTGNLVINSSATTTGEKDITLNNGTGDITVAENANLTAGNDITMTTTGNINTNNSTLVAANKVGLSATGNIATAGNVSGKDVEMTSTSGGINTNSSEIKATNNVTLNAAKDITNKNIITAGKNILANNTNGDLLLNKLEGENIALNTTTGNITLTGDSTAKAGDIKVTLGTATKDGIIVNGNLVASNDVNVSTTTGNIAITGNTTGNNNVALNTTDGNITVKGDINSNGVGRVETSATGNININNFVAQNDLYVTTAKGDIIGDNLESTTGSVNISSTEKGKVTIDDIKAGTTADIVTKDGDIDITNLLANKEINISTENGNITSNGSLTSVNESMKVYSAKGDIKINDSYAKDENRVTAKDGDIYIKKINGDFVIITLGNKDKEMKVDETIVGKGAILSGNDITVDNLGQREGETTAVEIIFNNSEDNKNAPINNIELHAKGIENGVKVNRLWVHDANITTDSKVLQFPELVVTGKGFFANDSTTVSVYGENSIFDGSNIHIWNDADKKEWITLNFLPQTNLVYTDGRLLKLQDGYNVYYQRITAKDYMINHLDYLSMEHKLNEIRDPFNYLYNSYLQYNLIDNNIKIDNSLEIVATEDDKIIIKEDGEVAEITIDPSMKVLEKDKDLITTTLGENSK